MTLQSLHVCADCSSYREWGEGLLAVACQSLAEELAIPYDAPGGMPVYRLSLTLSFFYKFYLLVRSRLDPTFLPDSCHTAVEVKNILYTH